MARDERETGDRMLLNLGHTFGHAFEAAAGFSDRLLHGEAIGARHGAGLRVFRAARADPAGRGQRASSPTLRRSACRPMSMHVPGDWPGVDAMMELISQDKKVQRGRLTFILVRGIGAAFVANDVDAAEVRVFLEEQLSAMSATQLRLIAGMSGALVVLSAFLSGALAIARRR